MSIMKEETRNWLKKAEEDLGTAEDCLKIKRFHASAFFSQQAAEKALKALQIEKLGRFDKVHDLLTLADSVKATKGVVDCCIKLNPYYTITRYPDVEKSVKEQLVKGLPSTSKRVVEWAKQILKQ